MSPSLEYLRQKIDAPLRRYGVVRAGVFGSVARGDDKPDSDLDLLVEFESGRSLLDLAGLQIDLQDVLNRDVDIATYNSLHPSLRTRIMRELVPLL